MEHLQPAFREKVLTLTQMFTDERLPFRLFEGFRTPQRPQYLYAQGRTRPGSTVTNAGPWGSHHQYGVAGDFVLFIDSNWSWDDTGERPQWWFRLQEVARHVGVEPLSWEKPHLQIRDLSIAALRDGHYPPAGDTSWAENLEDTIHTWFGNPAAPPVPTLLPQRPPLDGAATGNAESREIPSRATASLQKYRVIARRGLRLRDGPGTEYDVVDSLRSGLIVTVVSTSGEWCQVDVEGDGLADGYCHSGFLDPLA
jgi:hypothetical protein